MNTRSDFDFGAFLKKLYRLKRLVIASFIIGSSLAVYLAVILPDVYRSDTLILISPQRVPAAFVTSTVTTDLQERLQSIVQEILSATQLERIVKEFHLYAVAKENSNLKDRIDRLRRAIKVDFRRNNVQDGMTVFQLSFESQDRETARDVTARLASLFIDQNMKFREQQAIGTKNFMNTEANRLRKELEQQEAVVNQYKAGHLYELPDQLDTNLRTLEQLRREVESNSQRLMGLQERKGMLQKQLIESDLAGDAIFGGQAGIDVTTSPVSLEARRKELESLLQRYSNKHPDVIRVKKEIEALESDNNRGTPRSSGFPSSNNRLTEVLHKQIAEIDLETQAVQSHGETLRNQIMVLQSRVNNSPVRAIELAKISRGYDITLKKYQDVLAKSLESELSENMEKNNKGEQFRVLDPPSFPQKPVRPNRLMIVVVGLIGAFAIGCSLAIIWDQLDTSFKTSDEVIGYVNVPLLATLPALSTRGKVAEDRRWRGVLVVVSVAALALGMLCVRILGPIYF
jgi:protein tyrosine kinase modulator